MDSTRATHPAKPPAQSFAPLSNFASSTLPTAAQPQSPFAIPSTSTSQTLAAPLQQAPIDVAQSAMSQAQPLAQALNASASAALPVAQPVNAEFKSQPNTTTAAQQPADVYPHQVNGPGGPTATAPFLQDFSLVAEAAKRAQMAVVMRDLESVTL